MKQKNQTESLTREPNTKIMKCQLFGVVQKRYYKTKQ